MKIKDELEMLKAGADFARDLPQSALIFLVGDLGAGKTTFVRGVLQSLGYNGSVKSPTYNIVESYELTSQQIYHFDLYRVSDAEELEYMGIRDYIGPNAVCFVEWPGRGLGVLPAPDVVIKIDIEGAERLLTIEDNCSIV